MAYTLQERFNITNGITPINTAVPFYKKCEAGIKKVGQDIFYNDITLQDNFIQAWITANPGYPVTQNQLIEIAHRMMNGTMDKYMLPMILDNNTLPADPETATDVQVVTSVRRCVPAFASKIGSGSF